jgi:hypothetical protein
MLQMIAATLNIDSKAAGAADPRKRRECEAAWRQHAPLQGRVPYPIKGAVAAFKRRLTKPAANVARHLASPERLIAPALRHRGLARKAALQALIDALPGAIVVGSKDAVQIRYLTAHRHLIQDPSDPGEQQDCVICRVALAYREAFGGVTLWESWLTETPDHALARVLERSPDTDLRRALLLAAATFTSADADAALQCLRSGRSLYLPLGSGALASTIIAGKLKGSEQVVVYIRAKTFLTADQLEPDQMLLQPATTAGGSVAAMLLRIAREATPAAAPAPTFGHGCPPLVPNTSGHTSRPPGFTHPSG